jgi:class 3 adenylate cyclase
MKILWCDDKAGDPKELDAFIKDWKLEDRRADILTATTDRDAISLLHANRDIGLLVIDLLWEGQPEHPSTRPVGVDYLENVRKFFPDLRVATRSVISKPDVLASLVRYFVELRVTDHFVSYENSFADLRKRVVLGSAEQQLVRTKQMSRDSLDSHLGDQWGAIMFADISGFTLMTEQLWHGSREALCNAMSAFYDKAAVVIAENGGIVDKFIGDEIMAVFLATKGEPERADAAKRCVDASRALLNVFRELERRFKQSLAVIDDAVPNIQWKLKAGIEAGSLVIIKKVLPGNLPEYCIIGRAVNLAARIKGLAGQYAVTLGPTLRSRLSQGELYETVALKDVPPLRNISGPTRIYRLANE